MSGWWISVSAQTPEECRAAINRAAILAIWEEGVEGRRWLEQLVQEGRLIKLRDDGYPNLYTARAGDVLALLERMHPPHRRRPPSTVIHTDRCLACSADQVLTITAWDES